MNDIVPSEKRKDARELMALIVMEKYFNAPFYMSESPDLYCRELDIGVEVVQAFNSKYNGHTGRMLRDMEKGIHRDDNWLYSWHGLIGEDSIPKLEEEIVKKMRRLVKYTKYKHNYLYVDTMLYSTYWDLKEVANRLTDIKGKILEIVKNDKNNSYLYFDKIFLNCSDTFYIWDWKSNKFYENYDLYAEYKKHCETVFYLLKDEIEKGIKADENTPYKKVAYLIYN